MKISDIFPIFANLSNPDGITDAELKRWITRDCHDRTAHNFEDEHVDLVRFWLRAMTGVKFIRGYQHGQRDGVDSDYIEQDGQYGTVHFLRQENTRYPNQICNVLNEVAEGDSDGVADFCQVSTVPLKYVYQINVFRDAGEATARQENNSIQSPIGSAPDVFSKIYSRIELPIFVEAMEDKKFHVEDEPFRSFDIVPEMREGRYEWQASGELSLLAFVTGSIRVPGADGINIQYCNELA